ncbi:MAG: DUF4232 domain-containing protein, partial [Mycobacterium sp.]|nr:DUF4232 domain-containing protein [Mycobacterium sp.]
MKVLVWPLPVMAITLFAGCSAQHSAPATPTLTPTQTGANTSATEATSEAPPLTGTVTPPSNQTPAAPTELGPCADSDLEVTNAPVESASTQRRVVVSFRNTSSHTCTMVGYPGADLVTPPGGVLINVPRRPANAAHRLTLQPGQVATADVSTSAIDTGSGNSCARWGQLVVTPPNDFTSHKLPIDLPI